MLLTTAELEDVVEQCVPMLPASRSRAEIRRLAEERVRGMGAWEDAADNPDSNSTDPKSQGSANIDYRISDLARHGRITSQRRNFWSRPEQGE
jgi:hypothetical protein